MKSFIALVISILIFSCSGNSKIENESKYIQEPSPGNSIAYINAELINISAVENDQFLKLKVVDVIAYGSSTPLLNKEEIIEIKLPQNEKVVNNLEKNIAENKFRKMKIKTNLIDSKRVWSIIDIE
jgi:Flp pilus assembly CpaF family ATPase